jgi:hypothetical protein
VSQISTHSSISLLFILFNFADVIIPDISNLLASFGAIAFAPAHNRVNTQGVNPITASNGVIFLHSVDTANVSIPISPDNEFLITFLAIGLDNALANNGALVASHIVISATLASGTNKVGISCAKKVIACSFIPHIPCFVPIAL